MPLIDRLQKVSDKLAALPVKFGDPRYEQLRAIPTGQPPVILTPTPMITSIPSYMATRYLSSGVDIAVDDVLALGVSRGYTLDFLRKSKYIIGENQKAELIDVVTSELMSYGLILRKLRGK